MRIQETVAVEALKLAKWLIAMLMAIMVIAAVLPEIMPRVTKASIFGSIELELVEQKLNAAEKSIGKKFEGAPEEIRTILINAQKDIKGSNALWIDDEPDNNTDIRNLFEEAGVRFEVTASSNRARQLLNTKKYNLVISDNGRGPGQPTGLDFFIEYKKNAYPPPWFFYSASLGNRVIEGAVLSTNNPYILIPEVIKTLSSQRAMAPRVEPNSVITIPWWFYFVCLFAIILTFLFIYWVLQNSSS